MTTIRPFSYRLTMVVEPQWAEIIRRIVGLKDAKEQEDFGNKLKDHLQPDRMLHRRYDFTADSSASFGMRVISSDATIH
jgi:hypothetical protein